MECPVCNLPPDKAKGRELIQCDLCRESECNTCTGISVSEQRVLQLKGTRVLSYTCKKCRNFGRKLNNIEILIQEEINKMHKIIEEQNTKITKQNELIADLLDDIKNQKECKVNETYANITKRNTEVLIVKPREKQESNKTKNDLKEAIDPKTLAIAVENIKEGKEGAVIINCNNSSTKDKIKEKVENEMGNHYNVTEGTQKNPKIIIRGVEEEFIEGTDDFIIDSIKEQNELETEESTKIQVYSKYKQKDKVNKGNVVLTVSPGLKNKICQIGKINIGWRRCVAHEFFTIIRCFKCARYGHIAGKCENNVTCYNCAGQHQTTDCKANYFKCINCVETNNKFKKSLDVNHAVNDSECACYKRILDMEARKTKIK